MRNFWRTLYPKVRADIAASLGTGGLAAVVLYLMHAGGLETDPELKAAIITGLGWIGGKIAAYRRPPGASSDDMGAAAPRI
jgi:hypothetical protein